MRIILFLILVLSVVGDVVLKLPYPKKPLKGSAIAKELLKLSYDEPRETFIMDTFLAGHVPESMRVLKSLKIDITGAKSKNKHTIEAYALGEYLSLGIDGDYIRCPISPLTAQKIADKVKCVLPTLRMVDRIWKAADIKLAPKPWGPPYDASMMSSKRFIAHSAKIDAQLKDTPLAGKIIAGHKKDVVITDKLKKNPFKVAIYGWQRKKTGKVIQSLYLGHVNTYKDYSHGIRLIYSKVKIGEEEMDIKDLYNHKEFFPAVNYYPSTVWRQPDPKNEPKE